MKDHIEAFTVAAFAPFSGLTKYGDLSSSVICEREGRCCAPVLAGELHGHIIILFMCFLWFS